jgi:hypothetical protein
LRIVRALKNACHRNTRCAGVKHTAAGGLANGSMRCGNPGAFNRGGHWIVIITWVFLHGCMMEGTHEASRLAARFGPR